MYKQKQQKQHCQQQNTATTISTQQMTTKMATETVKVKLAN
jgi:hypothetical protein